MRWLRWLRGLVPTGEDLAVGQRPSSTGTAPTSQIQETGSVSQNPHANSYRVPGPQIEGRITRTAEGWLLNPQGMAPITVCGCSEVLAAKAREILQRSYECPNESIADLAALIDEHDLKFKELMHSLQAYRQRCHEEFQRLEAQAKPLDTPVPPAYARTPDELKAILRASKLTQRAYAAKHGFSTTAVRAHLNARTFHPEIQAVIEKMEDQAHLAAEQIEIEERLWDLRYEAQRRAGVPGTAAEVLPIWDGEYSAKDLARSVIYRLRSPGSIDKRQMQLIDEGQMHPARWRTSGPIDILTCDECRLLMQRSFTASECPEVPVHPGCRCQLIVDMEAILRSYEGDNKGQETDPLRGR
jgi:hypothetical protein